MSKRIVVVNAGPRKNWNTDSLLKEAAKGAHIGLRGENPDIRDDI